MKPIEKLLAETRDRYLAPYKGSESESVAGIAAEVMAVFEIEMLALSLADEAVYHELSTGRIDWFASIGGSEARANRLSERLMQFDIPARPAERLSRFPVVLAEISCDVDDDGLYRKTEFIAEAIGDHFGETCDISQLPSNLPEVLAAMLAVWHSESSARA